MAAVGSLNESIDKAVRHYSSLFRLPTHKRTVLLLSLICVGGALLSTTLVLPSFEGLGKGLFLGVFAFLATMAADYAIRESFLKQDPTFDVRRIVALSFFGWMLWMSFILLGSIVAVFGGVLWWIRLSLLGFSAVLVFRLIVLNSISSSAYWRLLIASIAQPFMCIVPLLAIWGRTNISMAMFLFVSPLVGTVTSLLFLVLLNQVGSGSVGVPSISLFKAFMLNWIVDQNAPFESFLEKLGEEHDVEVAIVRLDSTKPKAMLVVPSVHPGPFKNIGSSLLPSMLKAALERQFKCVVAVPHGLFGHEFDLASQVQTERVVDQVVNAADFVPTQTTGTPFIEVNSASVTACCQSFGDFALLSFTLAPKTTEDLPQELGLFARKEATKYGLNDCIVINSHNSIDGTVDMQDVLEALHNVAARCLESAASLTRIPYEVGAATLYPTEFGLRDGMGPGGITAIIIKVGEQKSAYVIIDGNNMVAGLRERVLSLLRSIGINSGEVFTTDTHSVNAVILGKRGYHPVGEVIDHEALLNHIRETAFAALSDMEPAKISYRTVKVSGAKVIGAKTLETLCLLIDKTLQRAKRVIVPLFAGAGIILMLILLFVLG